MCKLKFMIASLGFVIIASCGGDGSSSSSTDNSTTDQSGTTYSGQISNSYIRTSQGGIANQVVTCVINGSMTVTIDENGVAKADTVKTGDEVTGVCDYVDAVVTAHWEGTASDGTFNMSSTVSTEFASAQNTSAGTYTDTTVSGAGAGSVTVKTPAGRTIEYAATYSFTLTAVE